MSLPAKVKGAGLIRGRRRTTKKKVRKKKRKQKRQTLVWLTVSFISQSSLGGFMWSVDSERGPDEAEIELPCTLVPVSDHLTAESCYASKHTGSLHDCTCLYRHVWLTVL